MFSALCLLISSGILFFILKYRVHVHLQYTPTRRTAANAKADIAKRPCSNRVGNDQGGIRRVSPMAPGPSVSGKPFGYAGVLPRSAQAIRGNAAAGATGRTADRPTLTQDVTAALKNLGCAPTAAKAAAERATKETNDLDNALRLAIAYARQPA